MEEVAAKRPEEVRAPTLKVMPLEDRPDASRATPPQSSLRDDSSSIEEGRALDVPEHADARPIARTAP